MNDHGKSGHVCQAFIFCYLILRMALLIHDESGSCTKLKK
jgi:hypothetical protein